MTSPTALISKLTTHPPYGATAPNELGDQFGAPRLAKLRHPRPSPRTTGLNREYRRRLRRFFTQRWESRPVPEAATYLIDGLVPVGALTIVYSESGLGKTRLLLQAANAIANGQTFHDRPTTQASVLYLDYEMGEAQLGRYGQQLGLQGYISPHHDVPVDEIGDLIRLAVDDGCGLVIIDSYASLANQTGIEGAVNSNSVAERILKPLADLAHGLGVAIVVLHHCNKGNIVYDGSQRIKGLSDMLLKLSLSRSSGTMKLTAEKARYDFEPLTWDASDHPNLKGRSDDHQDEDTQDKPLDWLLAQLVSGPAFIDDLKESFRAEFGLHEKALERAASHGVELGCLSKEKVGRKNRLQLVGPSFDLI